MLVPGNFRRAGIALIVVLASVLSVPAQEPFTLEQVMSSPFPDDLTAAPSGGGFAWVFNARGARNVWVALPPDYKGQQVTAYTEDDGQDLGELAWAPDGRTIVYTRGGDFEFPRRAYPNPRSSVAGVEQDVWAVSISGGNPRKLGEGHSPAVSPKGDDVAFVLKGQIWLAPLDAGTKAEQLIHDEGYDEGLRWSPEGDRLAFQSAREEHSLIVVYDFRSKTLNYPDPSVDHDFDPIWSPDGKSIAFIRIPANTEAFAFGPRRSGQPWSIRIADTETGGGHEVWKADEGVGSVFRQITADNQLFWTADNRLIFPWERDGWTHLYSVSVEGGAAKLLTPGEFEVEEVSMTPDRRELLFNSNENDIDRRHIWRESSTGEQPAAVTRGEGIEWAPVMSSDGKTIAVLHSDARWPARPAILTSEGAIRDIARDAIPADFPAKQLVVPQQVIMSAADGLKIHGQLFLPHNSQTGKRHPAVVFFHGGSRRQMLLGWNPMGYYHNAYALNQYLASRGFVVLSVNYRSGTGYGMEFREAINYGAAGASEFNDVEGAGLYLRSRPDVDPARIGLWGGSYGGYLTALGLARASNLFAAGVDMHGVHDWNLEIPNFVPAYNPQKQEEAARIAWESSPLASIKTWRSPILVIQGDDDRNVPFAESIHLVEALRKQAVPYELLVFPDEIHVFLLHSTWLRAYHATVDFLERRLAPPSP